MTALFVPMGILASFGEGNKPSLLINMVYHLENNTIPYITVFTKAKVDRKFLPVPGITVNVFLGQEANGQLIGTVATNKEGLGKIIFPVGIQKSWDSAASFTLTALSTANGVYEKASTEGSITKAKIFIDTTVVDGIKNIIVRVKAKKGDQWVAAGDVETKIIIKRSVGNLSVGDNETYTTDSSGQVSAEFKKTSIPGDAKGGVVIVAKTDENEKYGSISIEKAVPWARPFVYNNNRFDQRSLFATRNKAPLWLLSLAGFIFLSVWSVLGYLVVQIWKIRKAGKEYQ